LIEISVENLSSDVSEHDLQKLFSSYGSVRSMRFSRASTHSKYPGSGSVRMESDDPKHIVSVLDGRLFKGLVLRVREVNPMQNSKNQAAAVSQEPAGSTSAARDHRLSTNYSVESVEKVPHPQQGTAADWYRYTIVSGKSRVTGLHRGTKQEVTDYAEGCAEGFNSRSSPVRGSAGTWSSRNKK
jgi:RNA recognition motif-containing protein